MNRTILSLFDYSGAWSQPYADAGYTVIRVDIKRPDETSKFPSDVMQWTCAHTKQAGPIHGILAAPPCTDFAGSGAQYWKQKDQDGRTLQSLRLIWQVQRIVEAAKPVWWVLENPVGRLNKLVPEMAAFGPWYFQPHWFGDAYTKKTGLWGTFNRNLPRNDVEPVRVCSQGSWLQRLGGKSERTKELRSMTPPGFAQAFFKANP